MKKKLLRFGCGAFGGRRQDWGMFCVFASSFMTSSPEQ